METQSLDQLMRFENGGQNWGASMVPKNLGKKRQHASVAVEVDTDAGDDNEDTFEAYDGYMDDEPWSDEEDDIRKD
jgi:flagellar biosynthesis/type III secretory pathway M-ring protein FliF/YscJ